MRLGLACYLHCIFGECLEYLAQLPEIIGIVYTLARYDLYATTILVSNDTA